jgi:hypothetical protein
MNVDLAGFLVVIEGACDWCAGRPLDANPYSLQYAAEAHAEWEAGWQEARSQFPRAKFEQERARWQGRRAP